jgi:hypothetical protein
VEMDYVMVKKTPIIAEIVMFVETEVTMKIVETVQWIVETVHPVEMVHAMERKIVDLVQMIVECVNSAEIIPVIMEKTVLLAQLIVDCVHPAKRVHFNVM